MSTSDLAALKRTIIFTMIMVLSPVVLATGWQIISNRFAAVEMRDDIKDLRQNYVPNDIFEQYFIRMEESVSATQELHEAQRTGDLENVARIENELIVIRKDIRTLGNGLGLNLRSSNN